MKAPDEIQAFGLKRERDPYAQVISEIQKNPAPRISVPHLSKLLGVKTTTLNARFRRMQTSLQMVGRTSFIPLDVALDLAALHKYALLGWPTLEQASRLTGVKTATIKARCEKGRVEGHKDLTKRLRISPAELSNLRLGDGQRHFLAPAESTGTDEKMEPGIRKAEQAQVSLPQIPQTHRPLVFASASSVVIDTQPPHQPVCEKPPARAPKRKPLGCLNYDPDRPFAASECTPGQSIKYGPYDGRIVKVINDPFSPKILARFPEHEHPLMREVLLILRRNAGS